MGLPFTPRRQCLPQCHPPRRDRNPYYSTARTLSASRRLAAYLKTAAIATQAFDALKDARAMVDGFEKLLENVPDTLRDSLKKVAKPIRDSIRTIQGLYLDPEDQKGLEHLTQQLTDDYFTVSGLLEPTYAPPGGLADLALRQFEAEVRSTVGRINHFLENEWRVYRARMEAAKVPVFLDLKRIGD